MTESQTFSFFFSFFFKRFSETALLSFFSKCLFVHWCYCFVTFFFFFFLRFFFFRFSSLLAPASFFRPFSAFLGLSRPFAPSSFLGKVGTFQSEFLPIFYPRHGNVFGGAKANVISITRGFAHTNTSPQHFQANIFTMPSSQFTPTFSHRDACLLFFHLLQHHWTPHLLPTARACPRNLHNPPHKRF